MNPTPFPPTSLRQTTADDYIARMLRLQEAIASRLSDPDLDPEALARVACMSKAHFHRVFRGMFGETAMQHLRRLRLERAASRLRFHQVDILELALEAGYTSHEAFTRAFQSHFGMVPSAYRHTEFQRSLPSIPSPQIHVELRQFPEIPLVTVRHCGSYQQIGAAFERVVTLGIAAGQIPPSPSLYGIYHDDPEITPTEQLRSDVGYAGTEPPSGATKRVISGGIYAVTEHVGPYDSLPQTYLQLIGHWLPGSGYELCIEGVVEAYLNSPADTEPAKLRTEVRVRLQRR